MKDRCYRTTARYYEDYGGRGISVFPEWIDSFSAFLTHVGKRPSPRHSLDRYPNNDGNYEPGNVRWATKAEQAANRRSNVSITLNGVTRIMSEWSRMTGIPASRIARRLRDGWSVERTLSCPKMACPGVVFDPAKHGLDDTL
jgi:hypothetical protein